MQLVTLDKSQFSGALVRIPSRDLTELEPDWEVDPAGLIIMDKLGKGLSVCCHSIAILLLRVTESRVQRYL